MSEPSTSGLAYPFAAAPDISKFDRLPSEKSVDLQQHEA
jgi:hypothetical protein